MKTKVKVLKPVFSCSFCGYSSSSLEERNEHVIERHLGSIRLFSDDNGWGMWDYKEKTRHLNSVFSIGRTQ